MNYFRDVGEFHQKFGLRHYSTYDTGPPILLGVDEFLLRLQMMHEELNELLQAYRDWSCPGVADALVDLIYFAVGTAHLSNVDLDAVWAEVHRANMTKERATGDSDVRGRRGSGLDVVKPEGWTPPDIVGILSMQSGGRR